LFLQYIKGFVLLLFRKRKKSINSKKFIPKLVGLVALILVLFVSSRPALAQGGQKVIQLSGVVVGVDSTTGVPGVHIYVPKAGRGVTSNQYGYFSMPVLVGDSVVISSVGYKRQHLIISGQAGTNQTVIIELQEDTTILPDVVIYPFPPEQLFKEAILAMNVPYGDGFRTGNAGLSDETLAEMFAAMPMDASMNYNYYINQQFKYSGDRFGPRPNPLLNPFAWAQFIKSIKRGDYKRK